MKNKIKVLCLAIMCAVAVIVSCRKANSDTVLSIPELSAQLQTSQAFNRYMLFSARLKRGLIADKYNLTKTTLKNFKAVVSANEATNKKETLANMAKSFTAAGIDNAKEFVFLNLNIQHYHDLLLHDFPQLKAMPTKDAIALLHKVYFDIEGNKAHEPSIKDLYAERQVNQQKRQLLKSVDKIHTLSELDPICYSVCNSNCFIAYANALAQAERVWDGTTFDCQATYEKDYNAAETYEQEADALYNWGVCLGDADDTLADSINAAGDANSECVASCSTSCLVAN
ncbi:hypothetical protein KXQ82_09535 [Mucilaginibacter sp. HMF5004]|uniref:hypothetical protein n=1 Tax=Mucilaginibacter rivuli TaxID=2857527 RepID=UPI001C5E42F9|nr:hypothetical protein [Mucilaginibacter rivuli]MBW4889958.1 hypothetical protein [Mucilaginibacter rivuli]